MSKTLDVASQLIGERLAFTSSTLPLLKDALSDNRRQQLSRDVDRVSPMPSGPSHWPKLLRRSWSGHPASDQGRRILSLQDRFGDYDPTFELARIAYEQHHGVQWWTEGAYEFRAQLTTPEFHGSWLAGAILVAADATEAGTDPGRRYLAGDREPTCPEDRAWLALLDDVVAIQRFRLDREPLGVTWTQTFTPAEKSAHTALPGDDENLFSAGVTLIRQAQIRCDTNYIGNDGVLWRRHHDLRHAAGFPEWKWARYIDDTDILLGVPSPDYLWEKAAGFEDWLHEHPGKARWVPRVKAAFDRKERFHTRKDGSYRGGGWGRRAVAREPGFALIAALSILDENNDEWRRANGDQIDRLCESVITLNEQMSTQWWSQWTAANTTPGTPEQKWTAAVISLATLYAQTEKVPDPRSVTQPLDISEVH